MVAGALALAIWYFGSDENEVPQYQTAAVTRGDITQAVTANGQLNPVVNVQVGSQISGNIQRLYADFNSTVKSNQVVAQLDPAIYQAIVHQAEADLANARAGFELQQVETRRSEALSKEKLISQSEYDTAVAKLHQAEAQVQLKQASLERAKVDLGHCTIYAPVDGIVISRSVDVGQTVAASMNAPTLFVVANDLSRMQIDANVSEADVGTVEEGQKVTFTVDAYPNRTFVGNVMQIRNAPITVQNVVTYDTVVAVSNQDLKLKPGMTATVSIISAERNGVLRIPNAALRFRPPDPSTNQTFAARLLEKIGLGGKSTNGVPAKAGTNQVASAPSAKAPLTGQETPEELMRRMREMRERGEEAPPELRARMRELFQSGAVPRPGGGGPRPGGAAGGRSVSGGPSFRTVYVLAQTNTVAGGKLAATLKPVRIKTGITDLAVTEVTEGLSEGDSVVSGIKASPNQSSTATPGGASPFGGGRRF